MSVLERILIYTKDAETLAGFTATLLYKAVTKAACIHT